MRAQETKREKSQKSVKNINEEEMKSTISSIIMTFY